MDASNAVRARVFGRLAASYDRWRPAYPAAAVDWLTPPGARIVADVGAGTGKLTGLLLDRGLEVVAVEPDPAMLDVLVRAHPTAQGILAGAEALPIEDESVDAVLVGQAWHWFDQPQALQEARRVTRPGGWLGLVWNHSTPRTPWQLELCRLDPDHVDGEADETARWQPPGLAGLQFAIHDVPWEEQFSAEALRARLSTYSAFAIMPDAERTERLDQAVAVLEQEARRIGSTTVQFCQTASCAKVVLGR